MSFTGHRLERIRVELLTSTEKSQGYLDGISGGQLSWNANADLPGGGHITMDDKGQLINVSKDRIRIWWEVVGEDPWPLGVYVISAPSTQYYESGSSRDIILIDKLTVIKDDVLTTTLQVPAGANVVEAVVQQIQATGETKIASTSSGTVLSNPMTWEPGTTRLKVINDLLSVAGYWSLWTDNRGQFRVEPYIEPASRSVVYSFAEGQTSIHSPEWEYELALWEATNTVVMVSQADDDGNTWTAYAVDDNPDSPTSTVAMGRVLNPIVEENVEAASQLDLQQQANRKLLANSNVVGKLKVSHAPVPLWYNEAVRFTSQGTDTQATITKMSLDLTPGSLISAEWRQAA
jgi:hypothetical protein